MNPEFKYVVVSPVRDEEAFLEKTVQCMIAQVLRPAEWIIVDDGSRDRTGSIADEYAARFPWIRVVHRVDRGYRSAGSGVMEAFFAGFECLETADWNYLVKLDGDLTFEQDYFESCFRVFMENPGLGIAGGVIYNRVNGSLQLEEHPLFHVRGATKIYRRECWDAIGGLHRVPGWDTLDEVKANQLGWETRSIPDQKVVQLRFTGDASGQWSNWIKNGRASYIAGYHPLYVLARALKRGTRRPYLVASAGLLCGYVGAIVRRPSRINDPALIKYIRRQQLRRLLGRKSIWR